jgi:hypothetical protein
MPLMIRQIAKICGVSEDRFKPEMALSVLCPLMNTMVVNVMSGELHASIKALEGYISFHRILLAFCERYPALQKLIDDRVEAFARDERQRTKDACPNLGEFLPLLAVSDKVTWRQVGMQYLEENFDRNALWAIKKFPDLADVPSPNSAAFAAPDLRRISHTFDACTVSFKLVAFHVHFFTQVARPEGLAAREVAANYDALYGLPSAGAKEALQRQVKRLQAMNCFDDFFAAVGRRPLEAGPLSQWLRMSVVRSAKKGYHRPAQAGRR